MFIYVHYSWSYEFSTLVYPSSIDVIGMKPALPILKSSINQDETSILLGFHYDYPLKMETMETMETSIPL